jgi:hypothetical protein
MHATLIGRPGSAARWEGQSVMMTVPELTADALGSFLAKYMQRRYGSAESRLVDLVPSIARIAMECIGNSDALYHNVEHTMLVTLAGHDILRGRALHAHMPPEDYAHLIIACVTHDIGYVRGIFAQDDADGFVIDAAGNKVKLPRGASDAALLPHHVDRSKPWSASRASSNSMPYALPAPSKAHAFRAVCLPRSNASERKPRCCGLPT